MAAADVSCGGVAGGEHGGSEREDRGSAGHPAVREDEADPGRPAGGVPLCRRHRLPEERDAQVDAQVLGGSLVGYTPPMRGVVFDLKGDGQESGWCSVPCLMCSSRRMETFDSAGRLSLSFSPPPPLLVFRPIFSNFLSLSSFPPAILSCVFLLPRSLSLLSLLPLYFLAFFPYSSFVREIH